MNRIARPCAWLLGALWGIPLLITIVGVLVLPKDRPAPGSCSTFGCTFSEADGFALSAWYVGGAVLFPAGVIGVLVIVVVQLLRRRQEWN